MKICATCRFFAPHSETPDNSMDGICRRAPPALQGLMDLESLPVYWKCAAWPETFEDDWCGEWREKSSRHRDGASSDAMVDDRLQASQ